MDQGTLFFSRGNAKLTNNIALFSLPAGHSCPGAKDCLAKVDRTTGRLTDGKDIKYRCYAASQESAFKSLRDFRWHNFDTLRATGTRAKMRDLIKHCVDGFIKKHRGVNVVRIHASGDFYSKAYFDAWMDVAATTPGMKFYAYTKALNFWSDRLLDPETGIPSNVTLVASAGGKHDHLIAKFDLPRAVVVNHPEEAAALGIEIDHDDSHAQQGTPVFALLLHGQQPKDSEASAALKRMRNEDINYAYSSK